MHLFTALKYYHYNSHSVSLILVSTLISTAPTNKICDIGKTKPLKIRSKTQFISYINPEMTVNTSLLLDKGNIDRKKNHVLILANTELVPATFNEQILPPEQPIKASLISGYDRAATVLHILRVWERIWPLMIIDKLYTERTLTGKAHQIDRCAHCWISRTAYKTNSPSYLCKVLWGVNALIHVLWYIWLYIMTYFGVFFLLFDCKCTVMY